MNFGALLRQQMQFMLDLLVPVGFSQRLLQQTLPFRIRQRRIADQQLLHHDGDPLIEGHQQLELDASHFLAPCSRILSTSPSSTAMTT